MNYYNDFDKNACAWLRELTKAGIIPPGDVDNRPITIPSRVLQACNASYQEGRGMLDIIPKPCQAILSFLQSAIAHSFHAQAYAPNLKREILRTTHSSWARLGCFCESALNLNLGVVFLSFFVCKLPLFLDFACAIHELFERPWPFGIRQSRSFFGLRFLWHKTLCHKQGRYEEYRYVLAKEPTDKMRRIFGNKTFLAFPLR